jgi:hypothetical protein
MIFLKDGESKIDVVIRIRKTEDEKTNKESIRLYIKLVKAKQRDDIIYAMIRWELMFVDIEGKQEVWISDKQRNIFLKLR